jgi:hypothetical protein
MLIMLAVWNHLDKMPDAAHEDTVTFRYWSPMHVEKRQIRKIVQQVCKKATGAAAASLYAGSDRQAGLPHRKRMRQKLRTVELRTASDVTDAYAMVDDVERRHLNELQARRKVSDDDTKLV